MSSNSDAIRANIKQLMDQYGVNYAPTPDFSKVDPNAMQKIIGMNALKEKQDQLDLQLKLANQLQSKEQRGANAEGTSVPTGSLYIPPNPMNTALDMYSHLQGIMDSFSGKKDQAALNAKLQDALDSWQSFLQGDPQGQGLANYKFGGPDAASTLGGPASIASNEGDENQW
jgi:hypothetical protein